MSNHIYPCVHVGPLQDLPAGGRQTEFPMAGSAFAWFDDVNVRADTGHWDFPCAFELAPDTLARLSAPRPDLCGLILDRPRLMGIINVTPDSFSDGGDRFDPTVAVRAAVEMVAAGADILDIGGESTRPGADVVPVEQEIDRVVPAITAMRGSGITAPISIDTRKAPVAEAALAAGATMVNDVSALTYDTAMAGLVARHEVPVCLMHASGDPKVMQSKLTYDDVSRDVYDYLYERVQAALAAGISARNIVVDPGIGFGKTLEHNVQLLRELALFHGLGVPVLLGASRKKFIGTLAKASAAKDRMPGSIAVALHAAAQAAHIIRVHDVRETRQALDLWQALNKR